MPRLTRNRSINRLNLQMSDNVRKRLEKLRDEIDADSLAEVIRKSLATYEFLFAQKKKGGKVIIKSSGEEKEVILL